MVKGDFAVIIPARGGSKGIPRKNLRKVAGQTLVERAVRTAFGATWHVYVSTEDAAIASHAQAVGASIIHRPPELAADDVQTDAVFQHAQQFLDADILVAIQPTSVLVTAGDVRRSAEAIRDGASMAVLAIPFHGILFDGSGSINRDMSRPLEGRQALPPQWLCHGSIWAWRSGQFVTPWYTAPHVAPVAADNPWYHEIDEGRDLYFAEQLLSNHGNACLGLKPSGAVDVGFCQ